MGSEAGGERVHNREEQRFIMLSDLQGATRVQNAGAERCYRKINGLLLPGQVFTADDNRDTLH